MVGARAFWEPQTVLVTGAGPIGLLAAMMQTAGQEVHVLDRAQSGPKPDLVRALGATYHSGTVAGVGFEPDVIIECTGVGQVIAESIQHFGGRGRLSDGRWSGGAATRPPRISRRRWC